MRFPALLATLLVAACASSEGGGAPDAEPTPGIDGSNAIDSGGGEIDAEPGDIDATPGDLDAAPAIDADPGAPDATPTPDAMPGDIDAMPPDAAIDGSTCPTAPCDLVEQCGCATNQACDIDFVDLEGTACRGIATAGDENDTCAATNQCAAGYVCLGDATNRSCERYCADNSDCTGPRGQCVIQINDGTDPIPGAVTCSSNCNPATTTNPLCPTGWTCDLFTATFGGTDHEIVDCRAAGPATQGQSCATNECAAGLSCVNTGAELLCLKVCTRPAGTECASIPGASCYGLGADGFVVGGTEYGVCYAP